MNVSPDLPGQACYSGEQSWPVSQPTEDSRSMVRYYADVQQFGIECTFHPFYTFGTGERFAHPSPPLTHSGGQYTSRRAVR
jgi:hypothetical protein